MRTRDECPAIIRWSTKRKNVSMPATVFLVDLTQRISERITTIIIIIILTADTAVDVDRIVNDNDD